MSLKKQAIKGAIWAYAQQFGTQFISFSVSIILARFLMPDEFGLIGMISVFMSIGTLLFEAGMTSSLIHSENLDDTDYSTVFIFNLVSSVVFYFLIFLIASYIGDFYNQPILTKITRIYALSFVFSAFGSVQNTMLTKSLNFKRQALLTIPALLVGSIVALFMAFYGYGVWSLVGMTLANTLFLNLTLWVTSNWKPNLIFSKKKFKIHFNYGYKLTLVGIIDTIYNNIYTILIGKYFNPLTVGYYTRSNQMMMLPISNISAALNKVAFPLFTQLQNDNDRLRSAYKRIMLLVIYITCPIILLILSLAQPLILVLFTKKWLPMVPIFQVICLSGLLYPLHLYNLLILQVKGRNDLLLKLEVIKKILLTIFIFISFQFGLYGLLWGQFVFSILSLFINTFFAGKMINYSAMEQLFDMIPLFILLAFIGSAVYITDLYLFSNLINIFRLILGSVFGTFLYILLSYLFKFSSFFEIQKIVTRK